MLTLNVESLISLPDDERAAALATLTPARARALLYCWPFWARPEQLPPGSQGAAPVLRGRPGLVDLLRARKVPDLEHTADWLIWLVLAGRGFGKTRVGAETVIERAKRGRQQPPISLIGATTDDVRDNMICPDPQPGQSGIVALSEPGFVPQHQPAQRRLLWPNGAIAHLYSADEPDRLRGKQHGFIWADELLAWRRPLAWDMAAMGLRLGNQPQAVITTTPKPKPILVGNRGGQGIPALLHERSTVITRGSSFANRSNLAPAYYDTVIRKYLGTRLGRQELGAEILGDVEGALWTMDMIDAARLQALPCALRRVVVAIDPQASAGTGKTDEPEAPETGIVAAGVGLCPCRDPKEPELHGFVLEDGSGSWSPNAWGKAAVAIYDRQHADRIVGEQNNGGAMVEHTVRTVRRNVSYQAVHASQGKRPRAEPVAALYEQGKVHHVGAHPLLEDQLTTWEPLVPGPSPNRLDALVWALSQLMLVDKETVASKWLRAGRRR